MARLVNQTSANDFSQGPVEYIDVTLGPDEQLACVKTGIYLFKDDDAASLALLVNVERHSFPSKLFIEVMASERSTAETFLRKIADATRVGKAYRGKVFSLEKNCYGGVEVCQVSSLANYHT